MKYTYLLVDFFAVIVPLVFSFHPRIKFQRQFKPFFAAGLLSAIIFLVWDAVFTSKGVWGFNSQYTTGIYIFLLPIEELLFFLCIPFACVFTYHCLSKLIDGTARVKGQEMIALVLGFGLLIFGFFFWQKAYTASSFISCGLLLILIRLVFNPAWLGKFFIVFIILLLPFFIVNGILTGTGLSQPVVWYNNAENLGIRIFTIPFEDIFYGLELLLLNVFLYEKFVPVFSHQEQKKSRQTLTSAGAF